MIVYHFINRQFGLDNIRRRRLKVATIDDLNDPFELLAASSSNAEVRRAFLATKAGVATANGMLCFSRRWTNPVQWSHYADKHSGLCLGFEVPDEILMPVTYSSHRLDLDLMALSGSGQRAEAEMRKMLCTKYSHWRYENEVRCFVRLEEKDPEIGLYFIAFSDQLALKQVIVGHNAATSRTDMTEALGELTQVVSILKARLAFGSFKVVRQRNEKLWR